MRSVESSLNAGRALGLNTGRGMKFGRPAWLGSYEAWVRLEVEAESAMACRVADEIDAKPRRSSVLKNVEALAAMVRIVWVGIDAIESGTR